MGMGSTGRAVREAQWEDAGAGVKETGIAL